MSQVLLMTAKPTVSNQFDLAALRAVLGPKNLVTAIERNTRTGGTHYALFLLDSIEDGAILRLTADYTLSFPGRVNYHYNLVTLHIRVRDDIAHVIWARRLGRLTHPAALTDPLMKLACTIAAGKIPSRTQLASFLPFILLETRESMNFAADFPDQGADREEKLPQAMWEQPAVLCAEKIDASALAITLNLLVGERAQLAHVDSQTGDYRVFHIDIASAPENRQTLTFELHRQSVGFERRVFNALSLTIGAPDIDGLCQVESFHCNAGTDFADLPHLLPKLARIVASLQERKKPEDLLVLPFLSKPAHILWMQSHEQRATP